MFTKYSSNTVAIVYVKLQLCMHELIALMHFLITCLSCKYIFSKFSETAVKTSGSPSDNFEAGKYRDGTISRRPPQPIPRSPNNMLRKMHSPVFDPLSPCASSSNGTATLGTLYINV